MALEEYVGAVSIEINGREYEAISINTDVKGNKKLVKTMNRKRRAKGFAKIIPEFSLQTEIPIPANGNEPDWLEIDDAKITITPVDGGKRETYQGCFVTDMSEKYTVDGEAVRNITWSAVNRIME